MANGRLPIMRAVGMVYRDVLRAPRAMPKLVLVAAIILLALNVADSLSSSFLQNNPLVRFLKDAGFQIAKSFLLTPFLIAVHRFILIDEVTDRYVIDPRDSRFERFFAWSLLLWALTTAVGLVVQSAVQQASPMIGIVILFAATVVVTFVILRLTILFPAIAVGAPGTSGASAFGDTKGHVIGILFIFVLAILPAVAFVAAAALLFFSPKSIEGEFSLASLLFAAILTAMQIVVYLLLVAVASRVFQALAERVLRAPLSS
jgi:hypothetical protein